MALFVKKFGGTSLGNLEKIQFVAEKIFRDYKQGQKIIVVVSAMSGQTDKLESLAYYFTDTPNPREFDVLLATGEQVSISLLSIALNNLGCPACSYTGSQVKIKTDSIYNKARIIKIEKNKIQRDLELGKVIIVAGFQGVDKNNNITTLGRGGSDTTAVALAAAFKANECQIYTDVEGIYTTDPRIEPNAKKMDQVTFEEIFELSSLGAKVLQIRAVEFAGRYNVPVRVLSTFVEGTGTLISYEENGVEQKVVSGITYTKDEAKIVIRGIPDSPGIASQILTPIGASNIEVDMIVQNVAHDGTTDFTFTVYRKDLAKTVHIMNSVICDIGVRDFDVDDNVAKLSIVGVGMKNHAGVASKMFNVLGTKGVNIQLISTSEIKVSVLIDEKYIEVGVQALHDAFNLGKKSSITSLTTEAEKCAM